MAARIADVKYEDGMITFSIPHITPDLWDELRYYLPHVIYEKRTGRYRVRATQENEEALALIFPGAQFRVLEAKAQLRLI